MAKVKKIKYGKNEIRYMFTCPGCGLPHAIDDRWNFNNDLESPTFSPSLLVTGTFGDNNEELRCHSFITDGNIKFLNDCTHKLAGTTVELQDIKNISSNGEKA